ncbi:hypothetical protein ACIGXM_07345 [Kitasatospora sp. NPDC052896]
MRFEILRLDDHQGSAIDRQVVDAETARDLIETAARTGERLYIRPCQSA